MTLENVNPIHRKKKLRFNVVFLAIMWVMSYICPLAPHPPFAEHQ